MTTVLSVAGLTHCYVYAYGMKTKGHFAQILDQCALRSGAIDNQYDFGLSQPASELYLFNEPPSGKQGARKNTFAFKQFYRAHKHLVQDCGCVQFHPFDDKRVSVKIYGLWTHLLKSSLRNNFHMPSTKRQAESFSASMKTPCRS